MDNMNKSYYANQSSTVPLSNQWNSPYSMNPPEQFNGGLYTGEPFNGPHGNIPVIPTAYYMTHVNLKSANPPPGAMNQDIGENRPGNNYLATNKLWYVPKNNDSYGPYELQCKNINPNQIKKIQDPFFGLVRK